MLKWEFASSSSSSCRGALQAMTRPALWSPPVAAADPPDPLPAPHCSSSGSVRISAASPQARAVTAPYTYRLQGEEGEEKPYVTKFTELL